MDLSDKEKFDSEKRNGEDSNFHPANLAADWRFGTNIQNPFHAENSLTVSSSSASASMVDSFCPTLWDHPHSRNLACGENNIQTSSSNSYLVPARMLATCSSSRPGLDKPLDYGWNPSISLPKEAVFLQTGARILPQNLSQFPADSGFIDRAARLSCFSSGIFGDMVNPFHSLEPLNPFSASGGIHNTEVVSPKNVKIASEAQNENSEAPLVVSMPIDHGATDGSSLRDNRDTKTLLKPSNEESHRIETKSCESGEAEFSDDGQVDPANLENSREEPYNKEFGAKKRKRSSQDAEDDQVNGDHQLTAVAAKQNMDIKQKNEDAPPSTTPKLYGKSVKDGSKTSEAQREDYIHIRARRGQATNSHSLAERVRREKISERMKFLQDLVPSCSKVTGKAVMLDEIINYVQSLQRQVEFLSMKLATVNPRLDFNLEALLSKDILQTRGATSSAIGFSPDMTILHPQLHLSQQGFVPTGIPGIRNPSSSIRRTTNPPITADNEFKEAAQMPNVWDDELHNVLQMSFGNNMPFAQESGGSLPPGHMKVEL